MTTVLIVERVGHRYGPTSPWLFRAIDADFDEGTITSVTGPSGSGKSTFLSVVGGLVVPEEGQVIKKLPGLRAAWIFQQPAGLPRRTTIDVVAAIVQGLGSTRAAALGRASTLLETVGLGHRCDARQFSLSGGEQQRLAMACALAARRQLLLLDEPTAQLDRTMAFALASVLGDVAQSDGAAVVVATHDPVVAGVADQQIEIGL